MKTELVTIRLDHELNLLLTRISQSTGKNKSDIIRQALVCQLRIEQFEKIRHQVLPFAEARGLLIDEDIFSQVS
jgi:predicted transcriptional regulator